MDEWKKKAVHGYGTRRQIVQASSELSQCKTVANNSISRFYLSSPVDYQCKGGRWTRRSTKVPSPWDHDRREGRRLVTAAIDEHNSQILKWFLKFRKTFVVGSDSVTTSTTLDADTLLACYRNLTFYQNSHPFHWYSFLIFVEGSQIYCQREIHDERIVADAEGWRQRFTVILQSFCRFVTIEFIRVFGSRQKSWRAWGKRNSTETTRFDEVPVETLQNFTSGNKMIHFEFGLKMFTKYNYHAQGTHCVQRNTFFDFVYADG